MGSLISSHRTMQLLAAKSVSGNFQIPGYVKLADGNAFYIEREFDETAQADQADKVYEQQHEMYLGGDYSYIGAYPDPNFLINRTKWVNWSNERSAIERKWGDRIRRELSYSDPDYDKKYIEMQALRDAEIKEEFEKAGSPVEVRGRSARGPVHSYANRVYKVSLAERLVCYYDTNRKRIKALIGSAAPINDVDRKAILDSWIKIPNDDMNRIMVIQFKDPDDLQNRYPSDVRATEDWLATGRYFPHGNEIEENDPDVRTKMENWVVERKKVYDDAFAILGALKELADRGMLAEDDIPNSNWFERNRIEPDKHGNYDYHLPAYYTHQIPAFRKTVEEQVRVFDTHFRGGQAHINSGGGTISAIHFFDIEYAAMRLALTDAHRYDEIKQRIDERRKRVYSLRPEDCPKVPHLSADIDFFPHQGQTIAQLAALPEAAILDVDMGGGKTSLEFADSMVQVSLGNAKRPGVIMPSNTIPQQVEELTEKFGDGVNIIAITSESWNEYEDPKVEMAELIRNAPPNTIVLASYSWLINDPVKISTGRFTKPNKRNPEGLEIIEKDYWRARWLTDDCGVDMVTLDEAHLAKNLGTATSAACQQLSAAPVKRIGSGTLFPNNPDDIHGPMTFLNPLVFGSRSDFLSMYGLETGQFNQITNAPKNYYKQIRSDLRDVGMISLRRTAWMHMLPQRIERRYEVQLPNHLQAFYKALLDEIIDQLTNPGNSFYDEKAAKAWEEFKSNGGVEEGGAFEAKLLPRLIALDQFVTCPSAPIGGDLEERVRNKKTGKMESISRMDRIPMEFMRIRRAVERMQDKDKISPKVAKVGEIVDEHFSKDEYKLSNGGWGKVLILVQNIASAQHINRWLPSFTTKVSAANILFYAAGSDAALEAFKTDPNIKVLCAVDHSLRMGHNLQMANHAIRCDQRWTPGDTEQAFARVFRPGSLASKVVIDTVICVETHEVAKYGRLLSKYQAMRQVNSDYSTDQDVNPIFMSEGTIEQLSKIIDIQPYIDQYDAATEFDFLEAKRFAAEYGTKMITGRQGGDLPGAGKIAGYLAYYNEDSLHIPMNVKVYPDNKSQKAYLRVDDPVTIEQTEDADARALGLVHKDDGEHGYYVSRKMPSDMKKWASTCYHQGYTSVSITYMDAKGKPRRVEEINRDGAVSEGQSLPVETITQPKSSRPGDGTNIPTEVPGRQDGKQPASTTDTSKPTPSVVSPGQTSGIPLDGGFTLLLVQVGIVEEEAEWYAIYAQSATTRKGIGATRYSVYYHWDDSENVMDPNEGDKIGGIVSTTNPDANGQVPDDILSKLEAKVVGFDGVIEKDEFDWQTASQFFGVTPAAVSTDTEVPVEPEKEPEPEPDRVIEELGLLEYDGIAYAYVDASEDDADDLRKLGMIWFNAFFERQFSNIAQAQRILKDLERRKIEVINEEEFLDQARRGIAGRKATKQTLTLRNQLQEMRKRRKKMKSGAITLHYIHSDGHWAAVNVLENNKDLGRVRGTTGFGEVSAAYWLPIPQRSDLKQFVSALAKMGYQIVNWNDFVSDCDDFFSYEPKEDLALRKRPPKKTKPVIKPPAKPTLPPPTPPVVPPTPPVKSKPPPTKFNLPPLPEITNKANPLAKVVDELRAIHALLEEAENA